MAKKVFLGKNKGFRVEAGHPWIYSNEVERKEGIPSPGEIVEVYNFKKQFIGKGYINPKSLILVRLLTRKIDEEVDADFFFDKIYEANEYRLMLGFENNYRVVFGEADGLPALVVDKFGDYLSIQILALGMEIWKDDIVDALKRIFKPKGIYERNDVPVRLLEGLPEHKGPIGEAFDPKIIIEEPGMKFHVDLENGQKTGFFLDQKANRLAIEPYVKDMEVLDCFCYTGSFSLYAAKFGAKKVTAYDISEEAITEARKNAELNGFKDELEFNVGNSFDVLTKYYKEGRQFDTIILDPPAFTKSRANVQNALKGYKEINLKAMKILKPGGFLITCTCSHFITPEIFKEVLYEASIDSGKQVKEIEYKLQSKDHPVIWGIDETLYLKLYILQVL